MKFENEKELARYVVQWLELDGWETFKEVPLSCGTPDIVALKGDIVWIIECKMSLSEGVIEQAYRRLHSGHFVSIAVPESGKYGDSVSFTKEYFLEKHGIGVIRAIKGDDVECEEHEAGCTYHFVQTNETIYYKYDKRMTKVYEQIGPIIRAFERNISSRYLNKYIKKTRNALHELHKYSEAGSQSGGALTPFKLTAYNIRQFLKKNGPKTMTEIVESVNYHYASKSSAKKCLADGILNGWIKGIKRNKDLYTIDPEYIEEVKTK